jgi:hypothetical protein
MGLDRGALSLVGTAEELLGRKSSGSGLEIDNTAVGIRCVYHATLSIRKMLALTSSTSGSCSVGIVHSQTHATEFLSVF